MDKIGSKMDKNGSKMGGFSTSHPQAFNTLFHNLQIDVHLFSNSEDFNAA